MGNERNPDAEHKQLQRPEEKVKPPNPAEDLSVHGRVEEAGSLDAEGNAEAAEMEDEMQYGGEAD